MESRIITDLIAAKDAINAAILTLKGFPAAEIGPSDTIPGSLAPENTTKSPDSVSCADPLAKFDVGAAPEVDMVILKIAERCHEANRAYCRSIGDNSQPHYNDAPQWQKDSAVAGVKAALHDPGLTPEQSHAGWCKLKRAEGWIHGPVKNPDRKEHPCLCDYDKLPEAQKTKDSIFLSTVRRAAKSLAAATSLSRLRGDPETDASGKLPQSRAAEEPDTALYIEGGSKDVEPCQPPRPPAPPK